MLLHLEIIFHFHRFSSLLLLRMNHIFILYCFMADYHLIERSFVFFCFWPSGFVVCEKESWNIQVQLHNALYNDNELMNITFFLQVLRVIKIFNVSGGRVNIEAFFYELNEDYQINPVGIGRRSTTNTNDNWPVAGWHWYIFIRWFH